MRRGMMLAGKVRKPARYTFNGSSPNATTSTVYTFNALAAGVADDTRYVVVGVAPFAGTSGRTIASVTINGAAATLIVSDSIPGGSTVIAALYGLAVPAGTTVNVVVTLSASGNSCGVASWSIYDASSVTPASISSDQEGSGSATLTMSLNAAAGNVAISLASLRAAGARTFAWTGLTEEFDRVVDSNTSHHFSGAGLVSTGALVNFPVTVTPSGTSSNGHNAVSAAWI